MIELANSAAWLDALYGRCNADDGELVIVASSKRRVAAVHRVGCGSSLVAAAHEIQKHPGSYLKVNLMDYPAMLARATEAGKPVVGKISEVKTVVSLHLDVDAGKGKKYVSRKHAIWSLDQMPLRPSMVINSNGESGGFHSYWLLARPHKIDGDDDRKKIQAIARSWQKRLGELLGGKLDSTSNLDRVLRCVGVPRLDGGRVCLHDCDFSRAYQIEDFNGQ